jgi:hypothetical protein
VSRLFFRSSSFLRPSIFLPTLYPPNINSHLRRSWRGSFRGSPWNLGCRDATSHWR